MGDTAADALRKRKRHALFATIGGLALSLAVTRHGD
jgi:hypothetical protein